MNAPTKILFTIPNFITAGSGRAMLNIIERLDRRRFACTVCVHRRGGRLDDHVTETLGLPLIESPTTTTSRPYGGFLSRCRKLAGIFRPHGFTFWHSFHYGSDWTEPIIARMAGAGGWFYTKKNMNWHRRAWHLRTLLAKHVMVQNTDMLRGFFSFPLYRRKVTLAPCGVDTGRFAPRSAAAYPWRTRLRQQRTDFVVACVAELVPVKGHPTLLRALAGIPGASAWVAGTTRDEHYSEDLRRLAEAAGVTAQVRWLGHVDDVPGLLAEADVAVLATQVRGEGSPVAVLEAMACGKPVVATDVPGNRDLVRPGVTGLLVPPEDPGALAEALAALRADPERCRRLGEAGRRLVLAEYSLDRETRAYASAYERAMGRTR